MKYQSKLARVKESGEKTVSHSCGKVRVSKSSCGPSYEAERGGIKALPCREEITPLIISLIKLGELQTWVRGAEIDIPISANNESLSFPLPSQS